MELSMRQCVSSDMDMLRTLSIQTFWAAFGHLNTQENMNAYCDAAFGEDALRRQLEEPGVSFWFLYAGGELAGYLKLNTGIAQTEDVNENAMEIERIYVSAHFQGHGFGGYMIEQAMEKARNMGKACVWLGVWERNARAISFYETHGFRRSGTHDFYLGNDRQTDIIMQQELLQAK